MEGRQQEKAYTSWCLLHYFLSISNYYVNIFSDITGVHNFLPQFWFKKYFFHRGHPTLFGAPQSEVRLLGKTASEWLKITNKETLVTWFKVAWHCLFEVGSKTIYNSGYSVPTLRFKPWIRLPSNGSNSEMVSVFSSLITHYGVSMFLRYLFGSTWIRVTDQRPWLFQNKVKQQELRQVVFSIF
jgi:hypothetical protein